MSGPLTFSLNKASQTEIAHHLWRCDADFVPPLSNRVEIRSYSQKITNNATRFEAWAGDTLVGLVAAYCDDRAQKIAYITNVSVLKGWTGRGVASRLLGRCIAHLKMLRLERIELEVNRENLDAIRVYEKNGFLISKMDSQLMIMRLSTEKDIYMSNRRDYNIEIKDTADRQYAYRFDFDVMHPYMLRSFLPLFKNGNMLELGSFKGDFTQRLLAHFDDVTCVEASGEAIEEAEHKLGNRAKFVHSCFETAELPKRYDNIVLSHVLEHLDDPVQVLKKINDKWLAEGGRLFLVCPNANAPSRQIAVKMGLITHNAAVTPAEAAHGHRCTYSLDTLERDAVAAGLKIAHRSGIFFKALANFQWDRLLNTDIVSRDYLEGCYQIGQIYPDLCASIFLACEKGDA